MVAQWNPDPDVMERYAENTVIMTSAALKPGQRIHERVIDARYWLAASDRKGGYSYTYDHLPPSIDEDWKSIDPPVQVRWVFSDHYLATEFKLLWC
ncbi:MAG: hypothetical protein EOP83_11790 [Verrucomicrobiaceae bacterium]|nr:MAG: hypothetical protein EOP83_11790 [Verrucomicrobiaceae bacterium]